MLPVRPMAYAESRPASELRLIILRPVSIVAVRFPFVKLSSASKVETATSSLAAASFFIIPPTLSPFTATPGITRPLMAAKYPKGATRMMTITTTPAISAGRFALGAFFVA